MRWNLSGEDASAPDPVTSFLGSLGSCLLMSLGVAAHARAIEVGKTAAHLKSNEKGHVREVEIELEVETRESDEKLQRLIDVAERGCHIRALIRDDVSVTVKVIRI